MKKTIPVIMFILAAVLLMSGCLSVEKKFYTFKFSGENSGILTVKYYNIISVMDDGEDVADEDFNELLEDYINGDKTAEEYPDARFIDKRFFEEDGVLCAEIVFEFTDLQQAKLFRYKNSGPYMYCLNCNLDLESYEESNGDYGGDVMPVVFWESDNNILNLTTTVSTDEEEYVSLLNLYKEWEAGQ